MGRCNSSGGLLPPERSPEFTRSLRVAGESMDLVPRSLLELFAGNFGHPLRSSCVRDGEAGEVEAGGMTVVGTRAHAVARPPDGLAVTAMFRPAAGAKLVL